MSDHDPNTLTALDWIAVVITGVASLVLMVAGLTMSPAFARMYEDFDAALPAFTRVVMSPWGPMLLSAPALLSLTASYFAKTLPRRRALIVAGFVLAGVGWAGYCWGLYAPIFELAGSIK